MSEFASPTKIDWQGEGFGQVQFGDDSRQIAIFYWKSVRDDAKSASENKPIFRDIPYLRLHPPGERLNIIDRPANEDDKHRFPRQWNQFVSRQSQVPEGTPVDLLYPNHPAYADMLRAHGIYTVQQLAKISAHAIDNIGMGAQEAVNKAQRFISESGETAALNKLRKQLDDKDAEVATMRRQLASQKKQIDELFVRLGNTLAPTHEHLNPVTPRSYDPQEERINANHPMAEVARKGRVVKKPVKAQITQLTDLLAQPTLEPVDLNEDDTV